MVKSLRRTGRAGRGQCSPQLETNHGILIRRKYLGLATHQNLAMQVGVSVLKKSMDVPAQSALFLLESVLAPVAEVSTPVPVVDGSLGQNIDVRV